MAYQIPPDLEPRIQAQLRDGEFQSPEEIGSLIAKQQAQLHSYRWVDAKEKIVSIPIDRAMELVVGELAGEASSRAASRPVTTRARKRADSHAQ